MSNDTNKASTEQVDEKIEDIIEQEIEQQVVAEEAEVIDQLTLANLRVEELEKALAAANADVAAQKDSAVRAIAEMENIRRRSAIDVEKARKFALEKFVNELLPVIDNLERAISVTSADDEVTKSLIEGVELTLKTLLTAVEKFGVKVVDPQGETFNPEHHQAIGMQPSDEFDSNTVMTVMQKGYTLNERLLRPAMVMVAQ